MEIKTENDDDDDDDDDKLSCCQDCFHNISVGAIVLVSGREFAGTAALSIVETLGKVMDAVLLHEQLQVLMISSNVFCSKTGHATFTTLQRL